MRIILYIFIIITVFPFSMGAQVEQLQNLYTDFLAAKRNDPDYWTTVRGSAYENPEFKNAFVYLRNKPTPDKTMIRYNILFDEMEMESASKDKFLFLDNKQAIERIELDNKIFRYTYFQEGKDLKQGFLIELLPGKYTLYTRKNREFQEEKPPTGGYQDYVPPSIINKSDTYFVQFADETPVILPQSSRNMIKLFQSKGIDINSFAKAHKIKYEENSLIPLLEFINNRQ
jgi:hypothetical protein